ncbi:MAG: DUF5916 domain-containing protein [Acidobacteriota bacterium]|nr:DUF5916 domain-containing protein [Acidobacteriota bacterium]
MGIRPTAADVPHQNQRRRQEPVTVLLRLFLVVGSWFLLGLVTASPSPAQVTSGGLAVAPFPTAHAVRVVEAPVVDGEVLADSIWDDAIPLTDFVQNTPDEGRPASERTEVRIVYTADTLYFGITCYVADPGTIIVADSRRDSSLSETDSFQIIIDTYQDKQNGFVFGTNPAGVEYDGQVSNEGQGGGRFGGGGGRQQRGSGGGFNLNWDGIWHVDARVSDMGWSAEIAIPFRTLRYPSADRQVWGLNFQRNIRHRNEQSFWAPLPRQFNLNRLSLAGTLEGLEVPAQRNLQLTPYVLGEAVHRDVADTTTALGDFGADFKYSITPSLTLDLTYNTDFAQVEVDDQQINLDRFNLFFPEKRPFFLENAGLFSVGQPGQLEVFFSRRIGIDGGSQIPILGGGRLSGKVGNNTNIGFLNMQTDTVGATGVPGNNFTVARVRQDFVSRSNIGAMVVNRSSTGSLASEDDYNRSYAVDGRWGIGQKGTLSGFAAETDTPGLGADTHAYAGAAQYESERYRFNGGVTEVGPNFNPEVGFYSRRGYRRLDGGVRTRFRPDNSLGILELTPHASHFTILNFETGQQETQYTHIDSSMEWRNGARLATAVNITKEGVLAPFEIFPGVTVPTDTYSHGEAQLRLNTNRGAPISYEIRAVAGGFFGGDRVQIEPRINLRAGETINAELSWSRNNIKLPGGAFVTNLTRARVNYSFNTRMFVQALVQYNDRDDLWSSNIRFGLLSDANTGLFIVYNDIRYFEDMLDPRRQIPTGVGRTLTLKFSRVFDVLR